MNIVLVGPPASGKGTQAKMLAEKYDLVHISTGELLRNIVTQKGKLADEIRSLIEKGNFVCDELITQLLKEHLMSIDKKNGVLLDGYPRTLEQAKALEEFLKLDFVFELKLSEQSLVNRILDRYSCSKCGKSYIMSLHKSEICSDCGSKLMKRADDTEEIAHKRYAEYIEKTYPIVEFYKNLKGFYQLNAEQSIKTVFIEICKIIESEL